jgi:D-ribose pyranose/furanose isomerase RbsD
MSNVVKLRPAGPTKTATVADLAVIAQSIRELESLNVVHADMTVQNVIMIAKHLGADRCPLRSDSDQVAGPERLTVQTPTHDTLAPTRIEIFHYRAAIREPIVTPFGSIPAQRAAD